MNEKLKNILVDGAILCAASTVFALAANFAFSSLKADAAHDDPLVTAIIQGDAKQLAELVKPGAQATCKPDDHGRTALMRAAYAYIADEAKLAETDEKRASMIAPLLDHGAILDQKDDDGWTALMWASWSNLPKVTAALVERSADVKSADTMGNTALGLAAARGNPEVVRILMGHGADPKALTKAGQSVFDLVEEGRRTNTDKKLLKKYLHILDLLNGK